MATVRDETAEEFDEGELGDPLKIDYRLLPLAPAPSTKQPSLWELFLLGLRPSAPHFPAQPEPLVLWKRRET
jgi:hypothetical protein